MSRQAKHVSMALSMIVASSACSKDTCEDNPNLFMCGVSSADGGTGGTGDIGDTEGPIERECVPLDDNEQRIPYTYPCEGEGNGWMSLNIYGMGVLPPVCANWGEEGQPENPTTDDCVPLDMTMLPNGVPSPAACCLEDARPDLVHTQCVKDCAYAACKLAIEKLRGLPTRSRNRESARP